MIKTRFAPSPTGFLHVGGTRTALFAWLLARQNNGKFVLRIEDTDRSRHVEESEKHIMESLEWLGLKWDEGPVRQSERLEIYQKWAQKLIETGRAYSDPRSEGELDKIRETAAKEKKAVLFRNHRPSNPPVWQPGMPLRFRSEPKAYEWHDEVMGQLSSGPEAIDDFILIKSDGYPTYNFAHIIDDHEMQISHVIRSQEFLPSVPKFLNLYEALKIQPPKLATLPYVLGPDGKKKLSKRDGAKDVLDYRKLGYLPEALVNFLATLGWNDGTKQELFSVDELIQKFNLGRVQHSGAHFDEKRLDWMNGQYIRATSINQLGKAAATFWPESANTADEKYKQDVLKILQERLKFLSELPTLSTFFFEEPKIEQVIKLYEEPADKGLRGKSKESVKQLLEESRRRLDSIQFEKVSLEKSLNQLLKDLNSQPGELFAAIRVAVTGSTNSPALADTMAVIGRGTCLKRLDRTIQHLS